jgi:dUTP pyrophosphatase
VKIKIKKLHEDAIIPTYAKVGDAGADLYSNENVYLEPGNWQLIGTGIAISMPSSYVGLVHPRSGAAAKLGCTVLNAPGTVDSGYRGEIKVNLINHGPNPIEILKGDRIAQIVFQQFSRADFVETEELDDSERGISGHGSTGVN